MVKTIYFNALGRGGDLVDATGLAYWSGRLTSGDLTADQLVINIMQGAHQDKVIDFPKMSELVYAQEIGLGNGYTMDSVQIALTYNAQYHNDVTNWLYANHVTDTPSYKAMRADPQASQAYSDAELNTAANDFMQYYSQFSTFGKTQVMTDSQEAVIDVQLVGVVPTF